MESAKQKVSREASAWSSSRTFARRVRPPFVNLSGNGAPRVARAISGSTSWCRTSQACLVIRGRAGVNRTMKTPLRIRESANRGGAPAPASIPGRKHNAFEPPRIIEPNRRTKRNRSYRPTPERARAAATRQGLRYSFRDIPMRLCKRDLFVIVNSSEMQTRRDFLLAPRRSRPSSHRAELPAARQTRWLVEQRDLAHLLPPSTIRDV